MEVQVKDVCNAYKVATDEQKTLLRALFPTVNFDHCVDDERPITERVKTFEDAYAELGSEHPFCKAWDSIYQGDEDFDDISDIADILAYHKLRIVVAALNEGWTPTFEYGEYRWFPWFEFQTYDELQEAYQENGEEWANAHKYASLDKYRVVGRAYSSANADGGLAYASTSSASSSSYTSYGSRLAFRTKELAAYAGNQFVDLYADFLLIRKGNDNE